MNILFWNIRGLSTSCRRLRKIVNHNKLGLIALIEPFLQSDNLPLYAATLHFQHYFSSSSCKISLLWNSEFMVSPILSSNQFEAFSVTYTPWNFSFHLVIIYAKHTRMERMQLWNDLYAFIQSTPAPLILGGDFNAIAIPAEYRGNAIPNPHSMQDFKAFINASGLTDLFPAGPLYTWTGVRPTGRIWKRLDRVLISAQILDSLSNPHVQHLNRATSDHNPILFSVVSNSLPVPKQFRFQHMWITHDNFQEVVRQNWSLHAAGGGMRSLAFKINRLKQALRSWNSRVFGNIFDAVAHAEHKVKQAESDFDSSPSPVTREILSREQANLLLQLRREEIF